MDGFEEQKNSQAGNPDPFEPEGNETRSHPEPEPIILSREDYHTSASPETGEPAAGQRRNENGSPYGGDCFNPETQNPSSASFQRQSGGYAPFGEPVGQNSSGLAIASFVLGLISAIFAFLTGCCCGGFFALPLALIGGILGAVSLAKRENGRGMAIAGVILSAIAVILSIIFLVFWLAVVGVDGYFYNSSSPYMSF